MKKSLMTLGVAVFFGVSGTCAAAGVDLPGDPVKGKQVYDSVCFVCHGQGIAGAPKIGNKDAWGPRIAQGMDVLVSHATSGFTGKKGTMPPKGGRGDLSDTDIANGVSYLVSQATE